MKIRFFDFLIYLLYFSTPLESIAIMNSFSITKLVVILIFTFSLKNLITNSLVNYKFIKLTSLYCIFAMLSLIWSVDKVSSFYAAFTNLLPTILLTFILLQAIKNKTQLTNIFVSYILGALVIALTTIYSYFNFYKFELYDYARATAFEQDQNELCFLLSFGIVLILYMIQFTQQSNRVRILSVLSAIVLLYAILLTGSRTGFIIILLIGFVYIFTKVNFSKIFLIFPFLVIVGLYFINLLNESVSLRLLETFDQIESSNLTGRTEIWEIGVNSFLETSKILYGTGYDSFQEYHKGLTFENYGRAIHNTFLANFIELGLIGLILFLNIIFYLSRKILFLYNKISIFFVLFLAPILIAMMTLGLSKRRWLFLIGVIIIKLVEEYKKSEKQMFKKKLNTL